MLTTSSDISHGWLDRRFVVVAGKGGVGRTTVAAALALAACRRGRRVLLAQVRARDSANQLLGGPEVGDTLVESRPHLWSVNMTPPAALHEYGLMVLRFETVYRAVFENRFVRAFLRAVPGLDEYSMLGKAWYHTTETRKDGNRFDMVVFDGPATGHLIPMLRLPRVILDSVPPGPLVRDATHLWKLLTDPARTVVHMVTLPEEMPVSETIDLQRAIRDDLGMPLGLLMVNRVVPNHIPEGSPAARLLDEISPADSRLQSLFDRACLIRRRHRMQQHYIDRLRAEVALPALLLPQLFVPRIGPDQISHLANILDHSDLPSMTTSVSPTSTV